MGQFLDLEGTKILANKIKEADNKIETLKSSQSLEYTGNNITCENTLTSRTSDVVVKGQTYQNLIDYNDATMKGSSTATVEKSQNSIKATVTKNGSSIVYFPCKMLKDNTVYTLLFNLITNYNSSTLTASFKQGGNFAESVINIKSGYCKIKITTTTANEGICIGNLGVEGVGNNIEIQNLIVLEGDWTNKEVPESITGIESAGEKENKISILSHNKNYYPRKNDCIINLSNAEQNWFSLNGKPGLFGNIESKVDKDLIFFLDKGDYICTWDCDGCYAQLIKMDDTMLTGQSGKQITVDKRTKLTFRLKNTSADITQFSIKNIMIRKVNANSTYEPYKGDKKEILLPVEGGLKSLPNGVCDTIEQRADGVYLVQRVGKFILANLNYTTASNDTTGLIVRTTTSDVAPLTNINYLSNLNIGISNAWDFNGWFGKFPIAINTQNMQNYNMQGIEILVQKRNITSITDLASFKKYLQDNSAVLYYELDTPVETKLNINNLDLEVFKDVTYVTTDNAIQPVLSFKVPSNIGGVLEGNSQNINKLYKDVAELEDMVSNPNLFVNGDFQIWSNGEILRNLNGGQELADRWNLSVFGSSNEPQSKMTVSKTNDGMKLVCTQPDGNGNIILQQIISQEELSRLRGKTITSSFIVKYTNTHNISSSFNVSSLYGFENPKTFTPAGTLVNTSDYVTYSTTFKIPTNAKVLMPQFLFSVMQGRDCTIEIKSAKLEIGDTATTFVPKLYNEELLACNDCIIGSNPNLLINGDFQIWSLGTNFETCSLLKVSADKWFIARNEQTVNKTDKGIKVVIENAPTEGGGIIQTLKLDNKYIGQPITLSASIKNTNTMVFGVRSKDYTKNFAFKNLEPSNDFRIVSVSGTLDNFVEDIINIELSNATSENNTFEVEWVKLELGSVATPFVPKLYSEELLACNDGIIGSNPNLLINGDFRINQRGLASYKSGYTVDRWRLQSDKDCILDVTSKGVKLTIKQVGEWSNLSQFLDVKEFKSLVGKKLTLTFKTVSPTNKVRQIWGLNSGDGKSHYYFNTGLDTNELYENGITDIFSKTFVLDSISDTGWIEFGIQLKSDKIGNSIEIEWAKLEIGNTITPFTPRPYGEELALCQRYYERSNHRVRGLIGAELLRLSFEVQYKQIKRTVPTLKIYGLNNEEGTVVGKIGSEMNFPIQVYQNNTDSFGCIDIRDRKGQNFVPGETFELDRWEADAEIY